ncbi:MAG: hypothetical protein HYT08_05025 [Candidatus Levybacteria bacterium]|nr:hypothetical protein [Candidatus Levybacteria bacterium]
MVKFKKSKEKFLFGKSSIGILLVLLIVAFGLLFSGILSKRKFQQSPITGNVSSYCCDTGSGDNCQPQTGPGQKLTFRGAEYGLLRTNTILAEGNVHLKDSGENLDGKPIILNSSDTHIIPDQFATADCRTEPKDKYLKAIPPPPIVVGTPQSVPYCTSIPNDEIIFVCKKNCHPATCSPIWGSEVTCYGDKDSEYDAYFRLSDVSSPGIPDFIKNCDASTLPTGTSSTGKQVIVTPTGQDAKKNLQLETFKIKLETPLIPWLSPFCKPAIYLYPEEETNVHVGIAPKGKLSYTIPPYPLNGWKVTARPDGMITYNQGQYDYLYYEAEIPDSEIKKPTEGFIVGMNKIKPFLESLLPKLSLNEKESEQFVDYWVSVLPDSPYYFIGVISRKTLDSIAPLSFSPKPDTIIRVTLYFEALGKTIDVKEPIINPIKRQGFTVVEWGGIFKKDINHNFSCFE